MLALITLLAIVVANVAATSSNAYATLVYNADIGYVVGACVLAQSLRETAPRTSDLVAVVTPLVPATAQRMLRAAGWALHEVAPLVDPQRDAGHMWHYVMTKLEMWRLPYTRVLYLDADTFVLGNATLEHLFACGEFCAVADPFPTDTFNSGVMVLAPSSATYDALVARIAMMPPHSFADQALLNAHFGYNTLDPAQRLPPAYNVEQPQYADYRPSFPLVRVLHYTTALKPWHWWTAALSVSAGPWNAARERLGAHCRRTLPLEDNDRAVCLASVVGNLDAPLLLFVLASTATAVIYLPRSIDDRDRGGGAGPLPIVIVGIVTMAYTGVTGIAVAWPVATCVLGALALAFFILGDASPVSTSRGIAVRVVRTFAAIVAAPAAYAAAVTVLPIDANVVAAHAAVFALYTAIITSCIASPLLVLVLPIVIYPIAIAVAHLLDIYGPGGAGTVAIIVAVALSTATVMCHGVAAWVGGAATLQSPTTKLKI